MAVTQVRAECLLCKEPIAAGEKALFIGRVETTAEPLSARRYSGIRKEHLRIRHLVGGKPRGLAHEQCFYELAGKEL